MRICILIGLSFLAFGCANDHMGARLASWQGSHFNEVAVAWGPPDACSIDANYADTSQRICEWQQRSVEGAACTTLLAFDTDDKVTGWRWRGDQCQLTATAVAANTFRERPDALSVDDANPGAVAAD